ncbi:MAG: hypothetical protein AUK51_09235 [Comamonadaceae bacterium CG2_30_59_20]|nr:MAG: hypothetical protein AUK51_09235 [Comamonadaceae bacterium CG2_30_59_20]
MCQRHNLINPSNSFHALEKTDQASTNQFGIINNQEIYGHGEMIPVLGCQRYRLLLIFLYEFDYFL